MNRDEMSAEDRAMMEDLFVRPSREMLDDPGRGQMTFLIFGAEGLAPHSQQFSYDPSKISLADDAAAMAPKLYKELLEGGYANESHMYAFTIYTPNLEDASRILSASIYGLKQAGYNGLHMAFALTEDAWREELFTPAAKEEAQVRQDHGAVLQASLRLGGYAAAHAANFLKDLRGGGFTPLYLSENERGVHSSYRIAVDGGQEEIDRALQSLLREHEPEIWAGTLVNDGYFTFPDGEKTDAILVSCYHRTQTVEPTVVFAIPYVPKKRFSKFKMYRTKLIYLQGDAVQQELIEQFFIGVDSYPKSAFWDAHTDESK